MQAVVSLEFRVSLVLHFWTYGKSYRRLKSHVGSGWTLVAGRIHLKPWYGRSILNAFEVQIDLYEGSNLRHSYHLHLTEVETDVPNSNIGKWFTPPQKGIGVYFAEERYLSAIPSRRRRGDDGATRYIKQTRLKP